MVVVRKRRYRIEREKYGFWERVALKVLSDPSFVLYLPFYTKGLSPFFAFFPKNSYIYLLVRSARRIVKRRVLPKYYLRHFYNKLVSSLLTPSTVQNIRKYQRNRKKAYQFFKNQSIIPQSLFSTFKNLYDELQNEDFFVFPFNRKVLDVLFSLNKQELTVVLFELHVRFCLFNLKDRRKYRLYSISLKIPAYTKDTLFSLPLPKTIKSKYNLSDEAVENVINAMKIVFAFIKAFLLKKVEFSFASQMVWMGSVKKLPDVAWKNAFKTYLDKRSDSYYIKFSLKDDLWKALKTGREKRFTAQETLALALGSSKVARERKKVIAEIFGIEDYEKRLLEAKRKVKMFYKGGERRRMVMSLSQLKRLFSLLSSSDLQQRYWGFFELENASSQTASLHSLFASSLSYADSVSRFKTTHTPPDPVSSVLVSLLGSKNAFLIPPPLKNEKTLTTSQSSQTHDLVYALSRFAILSYLLKEGGQADTPPPFSIPKIYSEILSPILKLRSTHLKPFINSILYMLSSSYAFAGSTPNLLDLALISYLYPDVQNSLSDYFHNFTKYGYSTTYYALSVIKTQIDEKEYRKKVKKLVLDLTDADDPLHAFMKFLLTILYSYIQKDPLPEFVENEHSSLHNRLYLNIAHYPFIPPFRPKRPQKSMSYDLLSYYYAYGHLYKRVRDLRFKMPCVCVFLKLYTPHSLLYLSKP